MGSHFLLDCPLVIEHKYAQMKTNITHSILAVFLFIPATLTFSEEPLVSHPTSIQAVWEEGRITSLRFDATGSGHFGPETIAIGGSLSGVKDGGIEKNKLTLAPTGEEMTWDLPFVRAGYYDADWCVNYPSGKTTAGAVPLTLPFRKFVTCAGQVVFIEHFKRLPVGPYYQWLNITGQNQFLMCGDNSLNYDLKVTLPGQDAVNYNIAEDRLSLTCHPPIGPITIEVLPRGSEQLPGECLIHPSVQFHPDFLAVYEPTGKMLSASGLLTDLLQMGIYWSPNITGGGEWGLNAVETHQFDDPRSWYARETRANLFKQLGFIGYDRMGHFGLYYAWGRLPDYGAGALLNVPENNANVDMRAIHLSSQMVQQIATYVLHSGDAAFLKAKRSRWVSTDGAEPQPINGAKGTAQDFVLSAGDVRLDGKKPTEVFTLGQIFVASAPFKTVSLRLGLDGKEPGKGTMTLRKGFRGDKIAEQEFTLQPGESDKLMSLSLDSGQPAGEYHVEILDHRSLEGRYFGPGIFWLTDCESEDEQGGATTGPLAEPTNYDRLKLLFDYTYHYTGPERENLSYHQNDPEYNIPNHKSGRNAVGTTNTYWECPGGGYESMTGLWYNAACSSMGEIAELLGHDQEASHYRELRKTADQTYDARYWRSFDENGKTFSRYLGCIDWDGVTHDYGFTYYNLEAAYRCISSRDKVLQILWWLDRGFYSPDGGKTWKEHIYSIWDIAPPFNTIENVTWMNVTGTLPFLEVLTNGGTRLNISGLDLVLRARHLSVDNMHERNTRILGRLASPDRLTGGRDFDDPGGRGRWHFGAPFNDRADIEGFREIFPPNGVLASFQPLAYLGIEPSAKGLWLQPGVPSELEDYAFDGLAYHGAMFDFKVSAERSLITIQTCTAESEGGYCFSPASRFNKVGVQAHITPYLVRHDAQISLSLDEEVDGGWKEIAVNWYNHVRDGQWVWVRADQWLEGGKQYRLRVHDISTPEGETLSIMEDLHGVSPVQLSAESIRLTIHERYNPKEKVFVLTNGGDDNLTIGKSPAGTLECLLEPGQRMLLSQR